MTILEVKLSWSNLGGSFASQDGRKFFASATEGWQVTHSADAEIGEVLFAPGLPQVGDSFQGSYLVCKRQGYASRIGPNFTIVTVEYEGEVGSDGQGRPNVNQSPINNPPIVDWSDETSNEPIDQDWDGNAIVNVNREPIDGVTMDVSDPVLIVQKNFATYNPHIIHAYRRATNSDEFASFPAGTARLIAAPGKLMATANNFYWQVTARFKFRYPYNTTPDKAWYARVRHEGFLVKDGSDISHALDDEDNKVVKPVLLKADGTREDDPNNAHWLEFKRYDSLPFHALGFL